MKRQLDRIEAAQQRIESKLDALLEALAEDGDEDQPSFDLDGSLLGEARDLSEPL